MLTFLTISGLLIAFAFFVYALNVVDSGKRKIKDLQNDKHAAKPDSSKLIKDKESGVSYRNLPENIKDMLPGRRCPLCLKTLTRDEPLYASFIETASGRKVLIYGCQYCYKDEPSKKTIHTPDNSTI